MLRDVVNDMGFCLHGKIAGVAGPPARGLGRALVCAVLTHPMSYSVWRFLDLTFRHRLWHVGDSRNYSLFPPTYLSTMAKRQLLWTHSSTTGAHVETWHAGDGIPYHTMDCDNLYDTNTRRDDSRTWTGTWEGDDDDVVIGHETLDD